jgi:O-antigen ligase
LKDYPLKGIGFGMLTFKNSINKEAYVNKLPQRDRPAEIYGPHNWLLDIAVRVGLIGLILFLAILFVFVKMCWKTIRHARDDGIRRWGIYVAIAFLAYFIMGLAEPLFYYKASAMMFYILLAMITILSNLNREDRTATDQTVGEK